MSDTELYISIMGKVIFGLIILWLLLGCVYQVTSGTQAIVLRFGNPVETVDAGNSMVMLDLNGSK